MTFRITCALCVVAAACFAVRIEASLSSSSEIRDRLNLRERVENPRDSSSKKADRHEKDYHKKGDRHEKNYHKKGADEHQQRGGNAEPAETKEPTKYPTIVVTKSHVSKRKDEDRSKKSDHKEGHKRDHKRVDNEHQQGEGNAEPAETKEPTQQTPNPTHPHPTPEPTQRTPYPTQRTPNPTHPHPTPEPTQLTKPPTHAPKESCVSWQDCCPNGPNKANCVDGSCLGEANNLVPNVLYFNGECPPFPVSSCRGKTRKMDCIQTNTCVWQKMQCTEAASLCNDGKRSKAAGETDVDCGGNVCEKRCALKKKCKTDNDCSKDLKCRGKKSFLTTNSGKKRKRSKRCQKKKAPIG